MARFRIADRLGEVKGEVDAESSIDALLAFHRSLGYGEEIVRRDGNRLVFSREEYRKLCGDAVDWDVRQIGLNASH